MEQDFLKELAFLGVTARIKRLSDALFYNIKQLYKDAGIDIEPGWHLVLLLLKKEESLGMIEIAGMLNLSKPAVTKMIKKMERKGYVVIDADTTDSRRKRVELSAKARYALPQFEKVWDAGQGSVQQILKGNPHFMEALCAFESEHAKESFYKRAIKNLKL